MYPINTSICTKTPGELQKHLDWLLNHDYEAVIKERKLPTGKSNYSVWRNPRLNEANIPKEGYWRWTGRGFWREDENPMIMTDCKCPTCGKTHRSSTGGANTYCSKCRPASRKNTEGYNCDSNKQKKRKGANQ